MRIRNSLFELNVPPSQAPTMGNSGLPALIPYSTISQEDVLLILTQKMYELGDNQSDIHIPDDDNKIYRKEDVMAYRGLKEILSIKYVKEEHDCDDFAAKLFGDFAGLVWTTLHSLNYFIAEDKTLYFIEPQTGILSRSLEGWQGNDFRLWVGR